MKLVILVFTLIYAQAKAQQTFSLKTPRGAMVHGIAHFPQSQKPLRALLVAPGRSCNSKGSLFEALGQMGEQKGLVVFRFEWSYCNNNPQSPAPTPGFKNEIEDFQTVLNFMKSLGTVKAQEIFIAGKSLGSVVAYSVFSQDSNARGAVLLTPVCVNNGEYYPGFKNDPRPLLFALGNNDPDNCAISELAKILKDAGPQVRTVIVGGDHGFRILDSDGQMIVPLTQQNILRVVNSTLNWVQSH